LATWARHHYKRLVGAPRLPLRCMCSGFAWNTPAKSQPPLSNWVADGPYRVPPLPTLHRRRNLDLLSIAYAPMTGASA